MNNYINIGSHTRSSVKLGVRQHIRPRRAVQLTIRLSEWKQVGKSVLWILPVLLILNVMSSSAISSMNHSLGKITIANQVLETRNIELLTEKAMRGSALSVKNRAADTLGLVEAVKGQVGVYNRQHRIFEYR